VTDISLHPGQMRELAVEIPISSAVLGAALRAAAGLPSGARVLSCLWSCVAAPTSSCILFDYGGGVAVDNGGRAVSPRSPSPLPWTAGGVCDGVPVRAASPHATTCG